MLSLRSSPADEFVLAQLHLVGAAVVGLAVRRPPRRASRVASGRRRRRRRPRSASSPPPSSPSASSPLVFGLLGEVLGRGEVEVFEQPPRQLGERGLVVERQRRGRRARLRPCPRSTA